MISRSWLGYPCWRSRLRDTEPPISIRISLDERSHFLGLNLGSSVLGINASTILVGGCADDVGGKVVDLGRVCGTSVMEVDALYNE